MNPSEINSIFVIVKNINIFEIYGFYLANSRPSLHETTRYSCVINHSSQEIKLFHPSRD